MFTFITVKLFEFLFNAQIPEVPLGFIQAIAFIELFVTMVVGVALIAATIYNRAKNKGKR